MKVLYLLITMSTIPALLFSQYASHKSNPDHSISVVKDFNDWSYKLSSTISIKELKEHVFTLASDEFEGRETGTEGNDKAANYISEQFKKLDLPAIGNNNSYFQKVAFTFTSWKKLGFEIEAQQYKFLKDFVAFPQYSADQPNLESDEIVFLGYGIDDKNYSDYDHQNVEGKVVIVFDDEPIGTNGRSLVSGSESKSLWSKNWQLKSKAAKEHGASLLIIISNDLQKLINDNRRKLVNRITQLGNFADYKSDGVNTVFLSPKIAQSILGSQRDEIIKQRDHLRESKTGVISATIPANISARFEITRKVLEGQNVLGYIEGSDKKDELVIISAHYDHIGHKGGEVYNGADDNSSGTTAVLEIAEALATGKKMGNGPSRSVLCLLVTGEEKGLLGSEYYTQNPLFPLEETIVDVNIDMIGRRDKNYDKDRNPYIYVIGSDRLSLDLHKVNEAANNRYSQLTLDYKFNDEKDPNRFYYRSDHYNFAKNGIPSIFFFNGVHNDYHRLTDTPDKIDFKLMQHRTRQIFHTVWKLSNQKEPIRLSETPKSSD